MLYKYKLHHLCFSGLIKAGFFSFAADTDAADTNTPPNKMSGICQITCCSLPGSVAKMHYVCAVK